MANSRTFSTIIHRSGRIGCRSCRDLHFDRRYESLPDPALEFSLQQHTADVHPNVRNWNSLAYLWGHRTVFADGSKIDDQANTDQNAGSDPLQQRLSALSYEDDDNMTPPLLFETQGGYPPMTVSPSILTMSTSIPVTDGSEYPSATATTYSHPSTSTAPSRTYVSAMHTNARESPSMPNPRVFSYRTKLGAFERQVKKGEYGPLLQQLMQQAFGGPVADGAGLLKSREDQMLDMIDYLLHSRKPALDEAGDPLALMINKQSGACLRSSQISTVTLWHCITHYVKCP